MTSTTLLFNLTFQDVKLTNFSLCNSKNIKMLLMLLISLELNQLEVKPPVKLQSSLKLTVNSPVNLPNTNICSKLKLLTNSSNKIIMMLQLFQQVNKPLMMLLILMIPPLVELKLANTITPLENSTLKVSIPPLTHPILQEISIKELEQCSIDSKTVLKKVLPLLKKTKSKPLSMLLIIKSKPKLKLLDSTLMLRKEKLILLNSLLILKLL